MTREEITSVGWLHNADSSIALVICLRNEPFHVFVTISRQEFDEAGGREGIDKDKQIAVDFYLEKGPGRPEDERLIEETNKKVITRLMVSHSGSINEFNAATGR